MTDPHVNPQSGEVFECVNCAKLSTKVSMMDRELTGYRLRLAALEADEEELVREDPLWPEAQAVHDLWALATGHEGVRLNAERFKKIAARLKRVGPVGFLKGVAGAVYDPHTKVQRNGNTIRYDDVLLIARSDVKLAEFQDRAPFPGTEKWRRYLWDIIERGLG